MAKIIRRGSAKRARSESAVSAEAVPSTDAQERLDQIQKNQAAIQLLRLWREGDEQEQRETWEYLERVLDEDRLSNRKLFS
jgi:hypothetical protein